MSSHINFKNFDESHGEAKPPGSNQLARQPSVYSLTFEEFQNTWGGLGKDFESMNMDELLKNIWTAEETHSITSSAGGNGEGSAPGGNLQRQGSLTLPRTLSQKTVDEVWRDLLKENGGGGGGGGNGPNMPQRQQTLGEMTLEEFLVRAGVVREDGQQMGGRPINVGFYPNNGNTGLALGFQQSGRANGPIMENNNSVPNQPSGLTLNVGAIKSLQQQQQQPQQHQYQPQQAQQQPQQHQYHPQQAQQQPQQHQYHPQQAQQPPQRHQYHSQQAQQQQQQPIFPKQATVAFASPMNLVNTTRLSGPGARGSVVDVANPSMNNNLVQPCGLQNGGMGMVGLGTGGFTVASGSPASQATSDVIPKSAADTSSLSPVPYVFGRGRKNTALEKVVERRHRRMIKNRESAARSRARKQAYTLELEEEVSKLKELNQELQKKQAESMEMQKSQILEKMKQQWGGKRQCLRRTLTGPW